MNVSPGLQQQAAQHRLQGTRFSRTANSRIRPRPLPFQPNASSSSRSTSPQLRQQPSRCSSISAAQLGANWPTCRSSTNCCTRSSFSTTSSGGSSSSNSYQQPRSITTCSAAAGDRSQPVTSSLGMQQLLAALDALYRFSRPHTMLGTFVSVVSVSSMALGSAAWSAAALTGLCQALVPALLMNIAIVGINQVYDVEIDKVNKPYLPLASGDLSMQQGVAIVTGTAALSLLLGVLSGSPPLLATLLLSLVLGILYSVELPFMRWKRSPWLAALCILAVRAVMVQLGFFLHMQHAIGVTGLVITRPLGFTMIFMLLFSIVIALFKDAPDVKGDTQAGVQTFSVRHGVKSIFWTCVGVLMAAYAGGIGFALTSPEPWSRLPVALGHAALAALLWSRSAKVNVGRKSEITDHYMFVWKLFYAEYLIIPFLR